MKIIQILININIRSWVFGLLLIILTSVIFFIDSNDGCCCDIYERTYAKLIIITLLSQLLSEAIAIWRVALSCEIKNEKIIKDDWILNHIEFFIKLDYIFISLNFIIFLYIFLSEIIKRFITTSSTYYLLKSLYNINIKRHTISNKFIKLTKKTQFQYLLNECKYIEYFLTKEQIDLINLINEYRIKYNLEKLLFDKNNRIPDFIIKKTF